MNKTAVIYSRVSSLGERQSNERQIEDLKILGKQKNYIIEKIYEEKISGAKKKVERPILTECLEYCFSNNVKILLISELSRLGRNVDEVLKNVMLCKENKQNVYFQKENLSIFDDSGKEHPFLTIFIAIQFLHNRCLFYYSTTSYEAFCSCFAWRNFSCIVGLP